MFITWNLPLYLILKFLNGFSTAVSGISNYKIHFCCSLLSLQKISVLDLPRSGNSLIILVIPKSVISALMKLIACCYHLASGSAFNFFALQKKSIKTVYRNGHCVLSKYNSILWIIFRCLEFHCVCSWIEFIYFTCWTTALDPNSTRVLWTDPTKGPEDKIGGKRTYEHGCKKNFHVTFTRLQLKFIVS